MTRMKQITREMDIPARIYKVLLIENDAQITETVKKWMAPYAEVTQVSDPALGAVMAQAEAWNLVIADIELTAAKGLDIIAIAKSTYSWTPVLVCSVYQNIDYTVQALQQHADGLLFKPFKKSVFLDWALKLAADSETKRKQLQKIVLAIGAHPDDVEIGCSGALTRHLAAGDSLNILTLSLGAQGGDTQVRKQEAEIAAQMLQAQLFLGNFTDTQISEGANTIEAIEEIVDRLKPTHIYTHSQHDTHQDHRNVYLATMVACRTVPNLYCYQSPSSTIEFKPNLFVEISKHIDHKIKVLEVYESQSVRSSYLQPEIIRATALYWGRFSNYCEAEPMEVIREQYG